MIGFDAAQAHYDNDSGLDVDPATPCYCGAPLEDHEDQGPGEPMPCEATDCEDFREVTLDDHLADEADRLYDAMKSGDW